MAKKNCFVLFFTFILTFSSFAAETSGKEKALNALSGLRLTTSYTNAFNLNNMDIYSKNTYGGTLGFEYTLLPELFRNFDLGFYGRAAIQNFVPINNQLIELRGYSFSGGILAQYQLPLDFSLFLSGGMGFLICDLDFISAEKGTINDIYYDYMIETNFQVRKTILKTKIINLLGNAGLHIAYYNEKTEDFSNIGPTFGLCLDFKPLNSRSPAGAKK